ncbi:hypothetical protein [Nannocystis radixulma]|uniref:Uncharacterized protein n=1 Tax=Nannocystis radixulma TaxID=2995305 RepID=A0ABT5BI34_9BACT|nr:hypothetical protein [Nannocystis radixulma]MDC0673783.1 hypothetical protein [Nannocystis radixulma]
MSLRRATFAVALACNPPASSEPAPVAPVEAAPPEPTCEEPPPGTLAWLPELPPPRPELPSGALRAPPADLPDRTCPWVLFEKDGELAVRPLGRGEAAPAHVRAPVPVMPPAGCRPCRWAGVVTVLGPILLAVRPSADSELAAEAWIGAGMPPSPRVDIEPAPLVFAPLWFGQSGLGDSTLQGPPWALAPRLCDRSLVLVPAARLPGAGAEEPPPALVRAAGVYAAAGAELLRQDMPVPSDMSNCTGLPLELP